MKKINKLFSQLWKAFRNIWTNEITTEQVESDHEELLMLQEHFKELEERKNEKEK